MTSPPDDLMRDRRRLPFCYQTHEALDAIRDSNRFRGSMLATALAVYLVLTEAANRIGGADAREGFIATRPQIAELAGISVDTLDRYVADLVKVGLVEVERRRDGTVNLANRWVLPERAPVPPVAAPVRPGGGRVGAAHSTEERKNKKKEPTVPSGGAPGHDVNLVEGLPTLDPDVPPAVFIVEGQNPALNSLCASTGVPVGSPRVRQAVAALNGSRGQVGIRHLLWRELCEWAAGNPGRIEAVSEMTPERFAEALVNQIPLRAALYREKRPTWELTPTALKDWWLETASTLEVKGRHGMSAEEMERWEDRGEWGVRGVVV